MLAESRPAYMEMSHERVCVFVKVGRDECGMANVEWGIETGSAEFASIDLPHSAFRIPHYFGLSAIFVGFPCYQHSVDALAVHIHDLQIQAVPLCFVADCRDMAQPVENQPSHGAEAA